MLKLTPTYWQFVVARAFEQTVATLDLRKPGRLIGAVALAAIGLLLESRLGDAKSALADAMQKVFAVAAVAVIFPAIWVFHCIVIPAQRDKELRRALAERESQLKPRLRLSFNPDQGTKPVSQGNVSESASGRRTVVLKPGQTVLRLSCTNVSGHRISQCRASLTGARKVNSDGSVEPIDFFEPVSLLWSREGEPPQFDADLDPGVSKAIYVMARRQHPCLQLFRNPKEIPIEYAYLFEEQQRYRLWISANGASDAADQICVDVWPIDQEGPAVVLFGIGCEVVDELGGVDKKA